MRVGSRKQFKDLKDFFKAANFTEDEVCRRFGIAALEEFDSVFDREQVAPHDDAASGILTRLFIEGAYVSVELAQRVLPSEAFDLFGALGLVEQTDENLAATLALYPICNVYIASDRWKKPDRSPFLPQSDIVYSALVSNAQRFLAYMPRGACKRFLDLCAGSGVAAIRAAKYYAEEAWSVDVADRCTRFAEFNRLLNDLDNVHALSGDLFDPVSGHKFDRIVAHPPYVPVLRPKFVYHDGGEDGEAVTRRIVQGLAQHLDKPGLFYMLATGSDREGVPYEHRVRAWLGDASAECDVIFIPFQRFQPSEYAGLVAQKGESRPEDKERFAELFDSLKIESIVYGITVVRRFSEQRAPLTIRRQRGPETTVGELEALLDWEGAPLGRIFDARVRANPKAQLRVLHNLGEDGWQSAHQTLVTTFPFAMEAHVDPWAAYLVALCDGAHTVREHFSSLIAAEVIPESADPEEFARAIAALASGGFLLLSDGDRGPSEAPSTG
jgi:methylase of polypeptide subunit release factors